MQFLSNLRFCGIVVEGATRKQDVLGSSQIPRASVNANLCKFYIKFNTKLCKIYAKFNAKLGKIYVKVNAKLCKISGN